MSLIHPRALAIAVSRASRLSALSQEILDIPVAQGEPEVEPDSVPDDIWRKSVVGIGNGLHGLNCYHIRRPICSLTCQCRSKPYPPTYPAERTMLRDKGRGQIEGANRKRATHWRAAKGASFH
jgi:hypothetical protein